MLTLFLLGFFIGFAVTVPLLIWQQRRLAMMSDVMEYIEMVVGEIDREL